MDCGRRAGGGLDGGHPGLVRQAPSFASQHFSKSAARRASDGLSRNISLNHGHFWPRGQSMRPSAARVCRTARPSPTETEGRPKFSGFGPVGRRNGYALSAKWGAGFLAPRINSPHASKALSSNPMFPDSSLTGLGAHPKCMKLLRNYYARVVADFFHRQVPVLQALQVSCKTLRATLVSARCWGHDDCTLRDSTSNHRGTRPKPETAVSHPL